MRLILHLPPRLADIKEIADIQNAIEPELDDIHREVIRILSDRNPLHASEEGVGIWEEWLEIEIDKSKSLEERRRNIVVKLGQRLPFTLNQLKYVLGGLLGPHNFDVFIPDGRAHLDITIDASVEDADAQVQDLLKRMVPAHVGYRTVMDHNAPEMGVFIASAGDTTVFIDTKPVVDHIADGKVYYNTAGTTVVRIDT